MATKKIQEDAFSMAAFDPSKFTENFRDMAEKSAEKSKEAYSKMKEVAEDATKTLEATMKSAQASTVDLGLKAIDASARTPKPRCRTWKPFWRQSVAELVEQQTAFFRKQAETTVAPGQGDAGRRPQGRRRRHQALARKLPRRFSRPSR